MAESGTSAMLAYDGFGNRVSKTVGGVITKYLVDELNPTGYSQVFDEMGAGGVTRTYTYGLQRISEEQQISSAWTPGFYGYDGGGTVRQLTNSSGSVTDTYEYDGFGNLLNSTGTTPNAYLYRGEQFDTDLGLYYLRARYYNPLTGRFMSRDPNDPKLMDVNRNPIDPKTLHKYLYAGGDPVNMIDPRGREDEESYGFLATDITAMTTEEIVKFVGGPVFCSAGANAAGISYANGSNAMDGTLTGILTLAGCAILLFPY
jgi:RHS repeat-associated protein